MKKSGIILEGGAMRSVFSAGALDEEGRVFIFRPSDQVRLRNNESHVIKLMKYYEHGCHVANESIPDLQSFLSE